jgi:hypothetical protein
VGFGVAFAGDLFGAIPLGVDDFFGVGVALVDRIICARDASPNIPRKRKAAKTNKTSTFPRRFLIFLMSQFLLLTLQRFSVSLQAAQFRAFDGCTAKPLGVSFRGKRQYLVQIDGSLAHARLERRFSGRFLETVPGAYILTNVAAVEPAF